MTRKKVFLFNIMRMVNYIPKETIRMGSKRGVGFTTLRQVICIALSLAYIKTD